MKKVITIISGVLFILSAVWMLIVIILDYSYDMHGNRYKNYEDVIYYTHQEIAYKIKYIEAKDYFVTVKGEEAQARVGNCVIDEEGYLLLDGKKELSETKKEGLYKDSSGYLYFDVNKIKWNMFGKLNHSSFYEPNHGGYYLTE